MTRTVMAALLLLAGLAGCSDPRADQAKALEAELEAELAAAAPRDGAPGILFETVTIAPDEEKETGFKGGVTGLALDLGSEGRFPIGTVSFLLAPDGDDLRTFSDIKLPAKIEGTLPEGVDFAVSIPDAGGTAIWSNAQKIWLAADLDLGRIDVASRARKLTASAEAVRYKLETQAGPDGRSDRRSTLAAERIAVATPETSGSAGQATLLYSMTGAKLAELAKLDAEYRKAVVEKNMAALADLLRRMAQALRGFELRFEATDSAQTDAETGESLALARSGFAFGMGGLDEPQSQLRLGFDYAGLALPEATGLDADERAVLPTTLRLNLDFAKVPTAKLIDLAGSSAMEIGEGGGPEAFQLAGMMLLFGLQGALAEAGTELRIVDSLVETAEARTAIAGLLTMDPQAMMGATGAIDLEVAGLDRLAARIDRLLSSELAVWLQQVAERKPAADGTSLARFRLALGADGSFTVNGQKLPE